MRGALIAVEGIDRAGKTTLCSDLWKYLASVGISAKVVSFPNRSTPLGRFIGDLLHGTWQVRSKESVAMIFAANRRESIADLEKLLNEGTTVICDRYVDSGRAYAVAQGVPLRLATELDRGMPKPDLTLYVRAYPDEVKKRPGFGNETTETADIQAGAYTYFDAQKSRDPSYRVAGPDLALISVVDDISRVQGAPIKRYE